MKAFISVDLEGMPFVVIPGHLNLKGSLYDEARDIATKLTLIVAEELHKNGYDKIIIADSHGPAINLLVEDLPECIELVRGTPRPFSMVTGVEDCDVAIFLGYHAKFGTQQSTFDHTYSGSSIHKLEINGIPVSEFLLNAYTAGDFGVPVILVAGDAQLIEDDVKKYAPWAETVSLKHSLSRFAAKSSSLIKIEKELRNAINKAITKTTEKQVQLLLTEKPVKIKVTLRDTHQTDVISLLPIIKRIDALSVEYTSKDMVEAYKTFQALVYLASAASGMLEYLR